MEDYITMMFICIGLLLVLAAILCARIFQYKRQMRLFIKRIRQRKQEDMNQPVTVEYFDEEVVELAVALNEYTDIIKEKIRLLETERRKLKNVIAGISHDFRTPLTSAKGYMQLIQKSGGLDEKNQEYLNIALSKTDYLRTLSDAFFEVSSLEAKEERTEVARIDLAKLLSEICISQYDWISRSGLQIKFHIPEQNVYVISNEEMLKRIFENLFSNASKYAKTYMKLDFVIEGKEIRICFENDTEKGTHIDIGRVFDAFYREASRHCEGAGLGLYVVKCLSDQLGHTIEAEFCNDIFRVVMRGFILDKS